MSIRTFISNLINTLLDGSFERVKILNQMNLAFKEYYYSGEFNRLCKASISQGQQRFAHEMSSIWLRSGFKISIENDFSLNTHEIDELAQCITENSVFVRQLMAMGFDTLIVKGRTTGLCGQYALKQYANLSQYFINYNRQ